MELISSEMAESIGKGSMIRRMFEAGIALKQEHGEEAVCDFSLGNPDLPPPPAVARGLRSLLETMDRPFALGYMPNGGYAWAREALAAHLSKEQGIALTSEEVILTCGAAGGLNALFKAILNPGDQVLGIAPYFVEYGAYVGNHGGVFRTVPSKPETFALDLEALEAAITPQTRALILNSPNNPTGQVYSRREISDLCALLERKAAGRNRPLFLVSDEPYRFLAYDGIEVPSVLPLYSQAIVASSFSKNLSMPGERIGYLALSPRMEGRAELMSGLILANRILGFVNPPVIGQHLMAAALGSQVDAAIYEGRRNAMAAVLQEAGYEFTLPKGAFYFFPKAPGGDDQAFADTLRRHLVLAVSGSAFGGPGYFRLAFCVDEAVIRRAAPGLRAAVKETLG
ncbi:MAG: pyridoxal phosphate-dependent aminotransferase [Deltaproteobacteria bacterium]|jgi:aspartate aminotransferase|nr:pyridoxal phosphate-dependent aminotransferase [Deltaproteobacteria bacterium]